MQSQITGPGRYPLVIDIPHPEQSPCIRLAGCNNLECGQLNTANGGRHGDAGGDTGSQPCAQKPARCCCGSLTTDLRWKVRCKLRPVLVAGSHSRATVPTGCCGRIGMKSRFRTPE